MHTRRQTTTERIRQKQNDRKDRQEGVYVTQAKTDRKKIIRKTG